MAERSPVVWCTNCGTPKYPGMAAPEVCPNCKRWEGWSTLRPYVLTPEDRRMLKELFIDPDVSPLPADKQTDR